MCLEEKYGISQWESFYLEVIRRLRGTSNPPDWLYKHSKKKYGWKNNLSRYWFEKYIGLPVGKYTYGFRFLNNPEMHSIGSFCSIGIDQHIASNGHNIKYVSSYVNFLDSIGMPETYRSIKLGSDIWVGAHSIIRSGVTIGDGAVIGTGSVITKDVAPYTVVVGSNRVIKQRFSDHIVEDLLRMKWWEWDDVKIFESMKYWDRVDEFVARYR